MTVIEAELNPVLCYITSARNALSKDNIIANAVAFYDGSVIYAAKETIFGKCDERPLKRKSSAEFPNPSVPNVKDILDLLDKVEGKKNLPLFVADKYNSLPPNNVEALAPVLCSLRDEISAMKNEVAQLRKLNSELTANQVENSCVQQDIAEIKLMLRNVEKTQQTRSYNDVVVNGKTKPKRNHNANSDNSRLNNSQSAVSSQDNGILDSTILQVRPQQQRVQDQASTSLQARNLQEDPEIGQETESNGQNNEWMVASRNRRRTQARRGGHVTGSRTSTSTLNGADRVFDLFVGGCKCDTTTEDITNYCKDLGVDLKKVEILESKSEWYRPFKLSMLQNHRDILLKAESWPQGIFVRKFYKARNGRNNYVNQP